MRFDHDGGCCSPDRCVNTRRRGFHVTWRVGRATLLASRPSAEGQSQSPDRVLTRECSHRVLTQSAHTECSHRVLAQSPRTVLTQSAHSECSHRVLMCCSHRVLAQSARTECSHRVLIQSAHTECSHRVLTQSAHTECSHRVLMCCSHRVLTHSAHTECSHIFTFTGCINCVNVINGLIYFFRKSTTVHISQ